MMPNVEEENEFLLELKGCFLVEEAKAMLWTG